jgi:hypothetical protein
MGALMPLSEQSKRGLLDDMDAFAKELSQLSDTIEGQKRAIATARKLMSALQGFLNGMGRP